MPNSLLKLALPALVSWLVMTTGCGGPERTYYLGGNSFFPLAEGRTLRYEEQRVGDLREYSLRMQYAGGHVAKIYPLIFKGADFGDCTFISNDSSIVFSTDDPLTAMEPRGVLPEYRQTWVDASAKVGEVWLDDDTGTETAFTGFERVEVPAGSFDRCYKTTTTARSELFDTLAVRRDRGELNPADYDRELQNARQIVVRWFAPGVGLVKEQIGSDLIRVLTKVEHEGIGVADTTRPINQEIQG